MDAAAEDQAVLDTLVGFVTIREVFALWEDAPGDLEEADGLVDLTILLEAAHQDLVDYAPRATFTGPIPAQAKLAQVLMLRHLAARKRSGNSDSYGTDGLQISTYPLALEAKQKMKKWRGLARGLR